MSEDISGCHTGRAVLVEARVLLNLLQGPRRPLAAETGLCRAAL